MSKNRVLFILLGLWLFAIMAPSVVTLIDVDKTIVVSNLNEEEQQEQGKKDFDEQQLANDSTSDYVLLSKMAASDNFAFHRIDGFDTAMDIVLPPPENS